MMFLFYFVLFLITKKFDFSKRLMIKKKSKKYTNIYENIIITLPINLSKDHYVMNQFRFEVNEFVLEEE